MLKWIKNKFTKEHWRLVKLHPIKFSINKQESVMYFKFYESNKKNRKFKLSTTYNTSSDSRIVEFANQIGYYHETVLRWKDGRYDPSVPSYNDIPGEDLVNAIKGSA